jgi:hypothetical protein
MSSDDTSIEPDPVVRTALQLRPVPEHGEAFWEVLERLVGHEAAGQTVGSPASDLESSIPADATRAAASSVVDLHDHPSLGLVPPALRRRSNALAAIAAVAAAAMVVVAGATLIRERSGRVDTADVAAPAGQTSTTVVSSISTLTSSAQVGSEEADLSSEAVRAWVAALAESDADAAWASMGPSSKQHLGTRAAFDELMTGLAEGFGAWSAATPDRVLVTPVEVEGDGSLLIVTLVGEVEQDGVRQRRADAFAVRLADGEAQVEPFDAAGQVEMVVPDGSSDTGEALEGDELVVVVPAGAAAPIVRLDDGDALVCGKSPGTELTELDAVSGQRCSFAPQGGIEPGNRVLTVAFTTHDGALISAQSAMFVAA